MVKKILIFTGIVAVVAGLAYIGIGGWQLTQIDYEMAGYKIKGLRNSGSKTYVNPITDDIITVIKALTTARFFDFDVILRLKNVSYLSVSLVKCDISVYLQGALVCVFKDSNSIAHDDNTTIPLSMPIVIEKNSISQINLPVSVDMKNSNKLFDAKDPNSFISLMATKKYDKILLNLHGSVTGSLMKLSANINIDKTMTFQDILDIMNTPSTGEKF